MAEEESMLSILKTVALENPMTAAGETVLNLGSQAVGLPVAGIAGIGASVGNALGLTKRTGADVVHSVGEAMTYQPRGEMGKHAAEIAAYPFQKLAEAGQGAGDKVLDAIYRSTVLVSQVVATRISRANGPALRR